MNERNNLNPENFFLTMNVLFFALAAGQIIYFVIVFYLISSGSFKSPAEDLTQIFLFLTPVIILTAVLGSKFIYSRLVNNADKNVSLENKMISYRNSTIAKLAIIEASNIFTITVMLITGSYFFAPLSIIVLAFFFLNKPARDKFITNYEVSSGDAMKLLG